MNNYIDIIYLVKLFMYVQTRGIHSDFHLFMSIPKNADYVSMTSWTIRLNQPPTVFVLFLVSFIDLPLQNVVIEYWIIAWLIYQLNINYFITSQYYKLVWG